jgi:LysR family glycine cleavage system transcriptional activator
VGGKPDGDPAPDAAALYKTPAKANPSREGDVMGVAWNDGEENPQNPRSGLRRRVLPPFSGLRAFEAVGQLGGIRRAALELGVDHAAVSRHLRALEAWAGVRLIDRAQGGRLTAEGARYHERISAALEEIGRASAELTRQGDDHRLMIWCVPGLAYRWLNGRLSEFRTLDPEIEIEVRPTEQAPDFGRHEADAEIRYLRDITPNADGDLLTSEIARPEVIAVASPALAAELPPVVPAEALLDQPLLHEHDDTYWREWLAAKGVTTPTRLAGPRLWHAHLTLDAARRGQGVALTNDFLLADDLDGGQLVRLNVTPAEPAPRFGAYVFRARRDRWRSPGILKFRRWLERCAETM